MIAKQIIVIRKDLKMTRGKEIAQGAHASMAVLLNLHKKINDYEYIMSHNNNALKDWLNGHFRKIVVCVESEEALLNLHEQANEKGLLNALIEDSGFTMFKGQKTLTALAIGPAYDVDIDPITKGLKLY